MTLWLLLSLLFSYFLFFFNSLPDLLPTETELIWYVTYTPLNIKVPFQFLILIIDRLLQLCLQLDVQSWSSFYMNSIVSKKKCFQRQFERNIRVTTCLYCTTLPLENTNLQMSWVYTAIIKSWFKATARAMKYFTRSSFSRNLVHLWNLV